MKFERLKILIEEFLLFKKFNAVDPAYSYTVEIGKNESLSDIVNNGRGIIDSEGNLYTGKSSEKQIVIHYAILKLALNFSYEIYSKTYNNFEKYIYVQREGNSNIFKLGESYGADKLREFVKDSRKMKFFEDVKKKFEKKNPDKKLVFEYILGDFR